MILSQEDLKIKYKDYSDVKGKVRREVADGNLIRSEERRVGKECL